jgi:hypothetical protein
MLLRKMNLINGCSNALDTFYFRWLQIATVNTVHHWLSKITEATYCNHNTNADKQYGPHEEFGTDVI